ncbi:hypothetical protein TNCV_273201 [Trichonephila clavipes]|nr:hypothetical protein TNCV_273201 [Trichonephila clavipes]
MHNVKIQGEAAAADETVAKSFGNVQSTIIDDDGYCPDEVFNAVRMPKSNAQKGKEFSEREKKNLAASPVEKVTKIPQKNNANSSSATAKSR